MILFMSLFSLALFSYIIRTIRNVLYMIFLWQLKEYRTDRFIAHLRTDQGKRMMFNPTVITKWILLLIIILGFILDFLYKKNIIPFYIYDFNFIGLYAYFGFFLIWIYEALKYTREIVIRGWKKPKFTIKALFILISFLVIQLWIIAFSTENLFLTFILFDRTLPLLIYFILLLANVPTFFIKNIIVSLARKKISENKNLIVIGITGSYGKTSTKEFLSSILSSKFKVLKTEGYNNTEIGVALTILKNLTKSHEIFVVEMGAYKKGEIEAICEIVKPEIGIITGINEQHLQLFGSKEKIMEAKYELIQHLKKRGIGVFNTTNKFVKQMMDWGSKCRGDLQIVSCDTEKISKNNDADKFMAYRIIVSPEKLSFVVNHNQKDYLFNAKLAGSQNVENLLLAISTASRLGMALSEITKQVSKITSPSSTMKLIKISGKSIIINDTFNANPNGITTILDYMKIFKGKKILVLTPLIELGPEAFRIHEYLGRKMADICDLILLTNSNYLKEITKMENVSLDRKKFKVVGTLEGKEIIEKNISKESIICFEGKEAKKIMDELMR